MNKHTPGPWHFQQVGSPGYFVHKGPNHKPLPQTVENARLIAAAPDLLAALLEVQRTWHATDGTEKTAAQMMRAAIAKATGDAA